jgi:hypothetical protein
VAERANRRYWASHQGNNLFVSWFRRRPTPGRDRESYPRPGQVAVVSGDLQEWEFIPANAIARHGHLTLLNTESERWLGQDEAIALRGELTALTNGDVSAGDRLPIERAAALVDHGVKAGTGIQVVPPA